MPRADDGLLTAYRLHPGRLAETLERVRPYVESLRVRARTRPNRPTPHRLVRLVEATDSDLFAIRRGGVARHLLDVIELEHVVSLLEEAEHDQIGKAIIRSLADPRSYAHNILVLAAARLLRGWGNAAELVAAGERKAADLIVVSPHMAVELKAPKELADDETEVARSPRDIARDVLDRASGQLRTAKDSILVVGGYRLPAFVIEALNDHLGAASMGRPALIAWIIMSVGSHPVDWPERREFRDQVALEVTARIRRNDAYRGDVTVVSRGSKSRGLRLPSKSTTMR